MGEVFVLSFLLLVFSTLAVGETGESPQPRKCDDGIGAVVAHLVGQQSSLNAKLQALETSLRATETALAKVTPSTMSTGSSFIRWGRKSCPENTALVYVGVGGGKQYHHKGSGTNPLCLTRTPQFDNMTKPSATGHLYGAEYEFIPGHHNRDVPCSVCLAPQSTTIMVPATHTCPLGWTSQYTGHLVAQWKNHYATEYVCLDGSPEDDTSSARGDNGLVFYYVITVCGSLPCPPFINNKVVTCVVCSK